jgi:hypothetical protein
MQTKRIHCPVATSYLGSRESTAKPLLIHHELDNFKYPYNCQIAELWHNFWHRTDQTSGNCSESVSFTQIFCIAETAGHISKVGRLQFHRTSSYLLYLVVDTQPARYVNVHVFCFVMYFTAFYADFNCKETQGGFNYTPGTKHRIFKQCARIINHRNNTGIWTREFYINDVVIISVMIACR